MSVGWVAGWFIDFVGVTALLSAIFYVSGKAYASYNRLDRLDERIEELEKAVMGERGNTGRMSHYYAVESLQDRVGKLEMKDIQGKLAPEDGENDE